MVGPSSGFAHEDCPIGPSTFENSATVASRVYLASSAQTALRNFPSTGNSTIRRCINETTKVSAARRRNANCSSFVARGAAARVCAVRRRHTDRLRSSDVRATTPAASAGNAECRHTGPAAPVHGQEHHWGRCGRLAVKWGFSYKSGKSDQRAGGPLLFGSGTYTAISAAVSRLQHGQHCGSPESPDDDGDDAEHVKWRSRIRAGTSPGFPG